MIDFIYRKMHNLSTMKKLLTIFAVLVVFTGCNSVVADEGAVVGGIDDNVAGDFSPEFPDKDGNETIPDGTYLEDVPVEAKSEDELVKELGNALAE